MYVARTAAPATRTQAGVWRPNLERWWFAALIVLCVLFFRTYITVTPWNARAHDCIWHLDYIHAIRAQHTIPGPDACPECTQPPAYYVLAEAWLRLATNTAKADVPTEGHALQILDAALGVGAAFFFVLTAYAVLRTPYERRIAATLIVFWPELYVESSKIGNDVLLYFFAAGALSWMVAWRRSLRPRDLILAALFAGAAANAKNNGYVVVVALVGSLLWAIVRAPPGTRRAPRGTVRALTTIAASVGFWLFSVLHWKHGVIHPNWGGPQWPANVTNDLKNFLLPAPGSFFDSPYVKPPYGNFWEYLFRTSLFGEWGDGNKDLKGYAYEILVMGLVLCVFLVAGLATLVNRGFQEKWRGGSLEVLLVLFGFVAFLLCFRTRFPLFFHNDFRFVLPIVAPCAVLVATGFERFRRRLAPIQPTLASFPVWMVVLFCVLSTQMLFRW
ncbi:MAG TPA: hypothetical protein VGI39_21480 [Polyangiaceae bacterium]|jgi:hypothetical protein